MGMRWLLPGWWRTLLGPRPAPPEQGHRGLPVPPPGGWAGRGPQGGGAQYLPSRDLLVCWTERVPPEWLLAWLERPAEGASGVEAFRAEDGRVVGFRVWGLSGIMRGDAP